HNADQVNGNTLTWAPTPKSGLINLHAESEAPRGLNFPPCGAAFLGIVTLFFQFKHENKTSEVSKTSEVCTCATRVASSTSPDDTCGTSLAFSRNPVSLWQDRAMK
ncbi:MAG: hypothetical protein L0287_33995, partial [Anaerolineae bacterium]|nr:hypothetical protein [Anaerolineae bacterium]